MAGVFVGLFVALAGVGPAATEVAPSVGPTSEVPASEIPASEVPPNERRSNESPSNQPPPTEDLDVSPLEPAGSELRAAPVKPTVTPDAAPVGNVRGRVLVYGGRDPVLNARLIPVDGGPPIVADDQGQFELSAEPGSHTWLVRAPGYEDLRFDLLVERGKTLTVELRLDPVLEAKRYRTVVRQEPRVAVTHTTLEDEEIHAVPGTGGDPLRVVQSLPGVGQLAGFLPYVVVRGAAPGNTGYYLDGVRVPALFHVAIGPSVIHPFFIDAVDFYPSGAPARLGRYSSGIIEARTRSGRRDRVHGEVEVRLTDAGGLLEIPLHRKLLPGCVGKKWKCRKSEGRGALSLAGRYSYTAGILSLVQSSIRLRYWDYQARFDYRLSPRLDYTIFAFGSFDELGEKPYVELGRRVTPDPFVKFQFHRINQALRQRLRNGISLRYGASFGVDQSGFGAVKTNEYIVGLRMHLYAPIGKRFSINAGLDQEFQIFRLADDLGSQDDFDVEDLAYLFGERIVSATGLYAELGYRRGRFEARPGVRADIYQQMGASPYLPTARSHTYAAGVDPRLVLREQVLDSLALRQTFGLYHQPPSSPIPIPGVESFGFERGLQRSIQGSVGYELDIAPARIQIVQDAYVSRLQNLQDYQLGGELIDELEDAVRHVSGWAYGLETMIRLDPKLRVFGWAAYTLSRATRDYPVGGEVASEWDQRHILNLVLGYRISHKWNFGFRIHYHSGRPWTAPLDGQPFDEALTHNRNNARLPPFFQLDLRVERTWRWRTWALSGVIELTNATYSREVFSCNDAGLGDGVPDTFRASLAAKVAPTRGIARCTPQGFRYVVPTLGLKARF